MSGPARFCLSCGTALAPITLEEDGGAVPMIVLTGRNGVTGTDPRIIGAVRRPAGLHDLYRLIQEALEETPRATPRIPTHLPARCRRNGQEWKASVLSLSENGCLLRTAQPVPLGTQVEIEFPLRPFGAAAGSNGRALAALRAAPAPPPPGRGLFPQLAASLRLHFVLPGFCRLTHRSSPFRKDSPNLPFLTPGP